MKHQAVRVIRSHPYAGKPRKVGEIYLASAKDAKTLSLIGSVELVADKPVVAIGSAQELVPDADFQEPFQRPRRRYHRKDRQAENDD